MTFPVGLRLLMSVAIDQRKCVKFGFSKFSLKPLSDLRKTGLLKFWLYLSVLVVFAFLLHGAKKSAIKIHKANRCEYYHYSLL